MMRNLVITVLLLVTVKVGYQEYLFRAATREVIVSTFQERAVQTCQKNARAAGGLVHAAAWARPSSVTLMIGKPGVAVWPWQINSSAWNARYRNPYLYVVADASAASLACEYDILSGNAAVFKL